MANINGAKTIISIGRVHGYLGMELDFGTCLGTLIISIIKYLQKIIDNFSEVIRGTKACLVGGNIIKIQDNEDRKLIPEDMERQFHRTNAQLLFRYKGTGTDVETLVSFLTTRVE